MKKFTHFILLLYAGLITQAQTSQKLTLDRNAYRAGDQLVKQQVEFKDPGSSGNLYFS